MIPRITQSPFYNEILIWGEGIYKCPPLKEVFTPISYLLQQEFLSLAQEYREDFVAEVSIFRLKLGKKYFYTPGYYNNKGQPWKTTDVPTYPLKPEHKKRGNAFYTMHKKAMADALEIAQYWEKYLKQLYGIYLLIPSVLQPSLVNRDYLYPEEIINSPEFLHIKGLCDYYLGIKLLL